MENKIDSHVEASLMIIAGDLNELNEEIKIFYSSEEEDKELTDSIIDYFDEIIYNCKIAKKRIDDRYV